MDNFAAVLGALLQGAHVVPTLVHDIVIPGQPTRRIYSLDLCGPTDCTCRNCQEDRLSLFENMYTPDIPLDLFMVQFQMFPIDYVRQQLVQRGIPIFVGAAPPAPVVHNVPAAVIATLSKVAVTEKDVTDHSACSICLADATAEEVEKQTEVYKLQCGHKFHQDCLNPWMTTANTCPVCRAKIIAVAGDAGGAGAGGGAAGGGGGAAGGGGS
jgi:hypothetical protein